MRIKFLAQNISFLNLYSNYDASGRISGFFINIISTILTSINPGPYGISVNSFSLIDFINSKWVEDSNGCLKGLNIWWKIIPNAQISTFEVDGYSSITSGAL